MKIKLKISVLLLLFCVIMYAGASDEDPEQIIKSALAIDNTMKSLLIEADLQQLHNRIEDHKEGFEFSAGFDDNGTAVDNIGNDKELILRLLPFAKIDLPEDAGTSISASVPIVNYLDNSDGTGMPTKASASLLISQDINKLFGIEKQNTAEKIRRNIADKELDEKLLERQRIVEKDVLELVKTLWSLQKSIISNTTNLDERESLLENMLKTGVIARNGSSHLSKLMEIRELETAAEKYLIDYSATINDFNRLTGLNIETPPSFPRIDLPVIRSDATTSIVESSKNDLLLKQAEYSDLCSPPPAELSFQLEGSQEFSADSAPKLSTAFNAVFEDFSLTVKSGWNKSDGGSVLTGVSLDLKDKTEIELRKRIYERNIERAGLNLETAERNAQEIVMKISADITNLRNAEKNLDANAAFINRYLSEMEEKYRHGLIPEIELVKARDQKKLIEIDRQILNVNRYLLKNTISSLIAE